MALPPLEEWRSESVRLSYFFAGEVPDDLRPGLWRSIVGSEPETATRRPAEGVVQEQGPFSGGQLLVIVGVDRIDFILVGVQRPGDTPDLGNVRMVTDELHRAVVAGAAAVESKAIRLACGLVGLYKSQSREDSYSMLDDLLSSVRVDPLSRDFFYQVNRQQQSKIDQTVKLNRLSRWSAGIYKTLRFDNNSPLHDVNAVRVELDCNTSDETLILSGGEINHKLMKELIANALSLIEEGEH